jgi:hypothetical protein
MYLIGPTRPIWPRRVCMAWYAYLLARVRLSILESVLSFPRRRGGFTALIGLSVCLVGGLGN